MSSTKFIKEFETQEMSKMMTYYHAVFNSVFPLYHILIKNYSYTYYKELVFLILEYLNLISFIFAKPVSLYHFFISLYIQYLAIWDNNTSTQLFNITKYIYIINLTRFNKTSYFIFLNLLIFAIIAIILTFIFAAVKINHSSDHQIPMWLVSILTFLVPAISSSFFGQIFYALLTIFYCNYETNSSFYSKSEECLQGIWFNIESVLCIIAMILLFCMAYVTNNVFYIPMCLKGKNKKIHSLNEVIFLITKIILNILFTCFKNNSDVYIFLILCNFLLFS